MKARIFFGGVGVLALIGVAASEWLGVGALDVKPTSAFADAPKPNADISNDPKVRELSRQIAASPRSLKLRRQLADRYVELGHSRQAADAYAREAALYRRGPRPNLGQSIISQQKTSRYSTDVRLFQDRPATAPELARLNTRARLEPAVGCYIGAFIDRDDMLRETYHDENWQTHRYPREFHGITKRSHATYYMYLAYKSYMNGGVKQQQKFPMRWLQQCKDDGVIPHISLEPHYMDEVQDDEYLHNFAKQLGSLDWPVFVRFASEMNGKWTPWSVDPATYKAKFRLVNRVLHRYGPKVATIWCPNSIPVSNITSYYPGDDGCDWVGVNFYCVPFYDNDPARPASRDAPTMMIDPIYRLYAARKPIAICEWGASRETRLRGQLMPVDGFAQEKMTLFYDALPRLYPRIKMVNWFNMNALRHAGAGRKLNNYNLTEKADFLINYRTAIDDPYFIKSPFKVPNTSAPLPFPLKVGQVWNRPVSLSIWVKSFVPRPRVTLAIDGKQIYEGRRYGIHRVNINPDQFSIGTHRLLVSVFDDKARPLATESTVVEVKRSQWEAPAPGGKSGANTTVASRPMPAPKTAPKTAPKSAPSKAPTIDELLAQLESRIKNKSFPVKGSGTSTRPTAASLALTAIPVSGIVERYFADETGMVTTMQIQTLGSQEIVYFSPTLAVRLLAEAPVGTRIEAWLRPRPAAQTGATAGRTWDMVALGFERPQTSDVTSLVRSGRDALTAAYRSSSGQRISVRGKVTDVVRDAGRQPIALVIEGNTLIYLSPRLRPAPSRVPVKTNPTALPISIEATGTGITLPAGALNLYGTLVQAQTLTTGGRALTAGQWNVLRSMEWKADPKMLDMAEGLVQALRLRLYEGGIEDMLARDVFVLPPDPNEPLSKEPVPEEIANKTGQNPW